MPPLVPRFIKYLKKNSHVSSEWGKSVTVTKQVLWNLAIEHGYMPETIKKAFRELDQVVYIGNWWNREKRIVEYIYYEMSEEEIRQREEDNKWFDELRDTSI